jgi:glucan phosphoethanolaminetransferase (alkaline phosphatase superfamily)
MAAHIVFIVDESIRGDWLGVNGGRFDTTPFLSSLSSHPEAFFNDSFFNYGVASATANLSGPANLILQSGLRPAELPDVDMRSMKNPNLFSYLQTAGFATFFIDAQHSFGRPPNFMTQADVEALDGYLVIRDTDKEVEEWDVDRLILPELSRIIRSHERSFSYVLKIGAHFPYSVRYPPEAAAFEAIDLGDAYDARQATIIREYLDTLRHGVDDFCRELVRTLAATGQDVVVLYTADHGQSLFEPWGSEAKRIRGHGHSPEPPSYQARVPVFILAFGDGPRNTLAESFDESLLNRTSAFELFPTLLRMAGFSREDIASRYHHSLFDRDADRSHRVFSSGNHFGTDGPLYRSAPYRSSFGLNDFLDSPPGPDSSPDDAQAPDWR